jgi:hypothetical protein
MKLKVGAVLIVGEHAGLQLRDERCVAGKNLHFAAASGHRDRVHGFRSHAAFRGYDFKLELISHLCLWIHLLIDPLNRWSVDNESMIQ